MKEKEIGVTVSKRLKEVAPFELNSATREKIESDFILEAVELCKTFEAKKRQAVEDLSFVRITKDTVIGAFAFSIGRDGIPRKKRRKKLITTGQDSETGQLA